MTKKFYSLLAGVTLLAVGSFAAVTTDIATSVYLTDDYATSDSQAAWQKVQIPAAQVQVPDGAKGVVTDLAAKYDRDANKIEATFTVPATVTYNGQDYDVTGKAYNYVTLFVEIKDATGAIVKSGNSPSLSLTGETAAVGGQKVTYPVEDVQEGYTYSFKVTTYWTMAFGASAPTGWVSVKVEKEEVEIPATAKAGVTGLTAEYDATSNAVVVNFTMPTTVADNGKYYDVVGKPFNSVAMFIDPKRPDGTYENRITMTYTGETALVGGQKVKYTLENPIEGYSYNVKVTTYWSTNWTSSVGSNWIVAKVPVQGDLDHFAPTDVKAIAANDGKSATIYWTAPQSENLQVLTGYNVFINGAKVNTELITRTNYTYTFAEGETTLSIEVEAVYADAQTAKSEAFTFTVPEGPIEVPANAQGKVTNLTAVFDESVSPMIKVRFSLPTIVEADGVEYDATNLLYYRVQLWRFTYDVETGEQVGAGKQFISKTFQPAGEVYTYDDEDIEPNVKYMYYVQTQWAVTGSERVNSTPVYVTTPEKFTIKVPEGAKAIATDYNMGYNVKDNKVVISYTMPTVVTANGKEYDVTGQQFAKTYVYRMRYDGPDKTTAKYINGYDKTLNTLTNVEAGAEISLEDTDVESDSYYLYIIEVIWRGSMANWNFPGVMVSTYAADAKDHDPATNLVVRPNADNSVLNLTWDAPTGDNLETVKGYNVYVNDAKVNEEFLTATSYDYNVPADVTNFIFVVETVYADDVTAMSGSVTYEISNEIPSTAWGIVTEQGASYVEADNVVNYSFTLPTFVTSRKYVDGQPVDTQWDITGESFFAAALYRFEMDGPGEDAKKVEGTARVTVKEFKDGLLAGATIEYADATVEPNKYYKYYVGLRWVATSVEPVNVNYVYVYTETTPVEYEHLAVVNLRAAVNDANDAINVTWEAPTAENLAVIEGYNVFVNGEKANEALLTATEYKVEVPAGTGDAKYQIKVQVVYADGETVDSDEVTVEYTGIMSLLREDSGAEFYTTGGVRVKNPETGLYIIVKEGQTFKIFIKR